MSEPRIVMVSARFYVPGNRIAGVNGLLDRLREWAQQESPSLVVERSGPNEVVASITYDGDDLSNGCVSAAAWLGAVLDRAMSEVTDLRWYGQVRIDSALKTSRDAPEETGAAGPRDGDEIVENGLTMTYVSEAGEWMVKGECRIDGDGNAAVMISDDPDGLVRICDILGGHQRWVMRSEWESWSPADESSEPTSFTDQVAAAEAEYRPPARPTEEF